MNDVFVEPIEVYYHPQFDNFILINSATIFMFATLEGSNGRKLCINKDWEINKRGLVLCGEL